MCREIKGRNRFTQDKEKGIKAYHYAKSSIQNGRQQERKKGTKELQNSKKAVNNMALIRLYLLVIIRNVNELNVPIKKLRVADGSKK